MLSVLNTTGVAVGPKPSIPTNLCSGADLVPPRFVMLWYSFILFGIGVVAMMIESGSSVTLFRSSSSMYSVDLTVVGLENPFKFLFDAWFVARFWKCVFHVFDSCDAIVLF